MLSLVGLYAIGRYSFLLIITRQHFAFMLATHKFTSSVCDIKKKAVKVNVCIRVILGHCTLWKADRSPACRAVMMALDSMNLSITEVDINIDKGEHRTPEMLVLNPLQTLPVFKDRELVLCDSHAICSYLAGRYCDSGRLLPKDPGGRSIVDQHMHYNSGTLYPRFRAAAYPILYENCNFVMPQQIADIECAYADLESMLVGRSWFGGSWATLSDIVFASTISTLNILVPIDKNKYPRLSSWLYRVSEELFFVTANRKGLSEFSRRIGELSQVQQS